MGLFSRKKSFKILDGMKLNVGTKGVSITTGSSKYNITTGTDGSSIKLGMLKIKFPSQPENSVKRRKKSRTRAVKSNANRDVEASIWLGFIISGLIFIYFNSFWIALIVFFLVPFISAFGDNEQATEIKQQPRVCEEIIVPKSYIEDRVKEKEKAVIIPVEKRLKKLYPNAKGLYPHEILFLEILPGLKIYEGLMKVKDLAPKYGINGVWDLVKELITERGYLRRKDGYYELTDRGKNAIKDDEYVLYAHEHGLDMYALNEAMKGDTENYMHYIQAQTVNNGSNSNYHDSVVLNGDATGSKSALTV